MKPGEAIERLRQVARRQHKAISTEQSYVGWLARYMHFVQQLQRDAATGMSPIQPHQLTSEQKLERFLTQLALSNVSASTQNQAFNAIVYFYKDVLQKPLANVDALRASRPTRVRHAPTVQETFLLLNKIKNVGGYPTNLIGRMLYGCGLRVTEPLNLRVKDVREDRLFIMGAKGRKDRVVSLPDSLMLEVLGQLDFAKAMWEKDCQAKIPVEMPEGLSRKYPEYRFAWGWAWLFPAHQPCQHPRSKEWVRWRCHEANVQRAIKLARRELGIMVLPHELRHAYATHCLDRGTNIKALQEAMGHEQVETTIGYCHAEALSVLSPLEVGSWKLHVEPSQYPAGSHIEMRHAPNSGFTEEIPRSHPPPGSHNAIHEPRDEILFEINNSDLMRSKEESQLSGGRARALLEEQHTQRAVEIAAAYRRDDHVMTKLRVRRLLREELMAGRTPTARKFAKLYATKPDRARELLATAAEVREGNPASYLNTVLQVEGVRY